MIRGRILKWIGKSKEAYVISGEKKTIEKWKSGAKPTLRYSKLQETTDVYNRTSWSP